MTRRANPDTRSRILAAALALFSRQGFESTTTRQITTEVGITPGALYYHFEGKSECLDALIEPYVVEMDGFVRRLEDSAAGSRADPRVLLSGYGDLLRRHNAVARLIDRDAAAVRSTAHRQRIEDLTDRLRSLLAGPDPTANGTVRASAALGALRRPILRLRSATESDGDVIVEAALAALGVSISDS